MSGVKYLGDKRILDRLRVLAPIQTYTSPALRGNRDGSYRLFGRIYNPTGGTSDLIPLINNTSAVLNTVTRGYFTGAAVASDTGNYSGIPAGGYAEFDFRIACAEPGQFRNIHGDISIYNGAGALQYSATQNLVWPNAVDEIVLLQLTGNAGAIGIDSYIKLDRGF